MDAERAGRRKKLEPDPRVRLAILSAASKIIREDGVRALSIAEVKVKLHVSHVLEKLSVKDRTQAATVDLKRGIISLE